MAQVTKYLEPSNHSHFPATADDVDMPYAIELAAGNDHLDIVQCFARYGECRLRFRFRLCIRPKRKKTSQNLALNQIVFAHDFAIYAG